jgi:hypothetical protein
VIGFAAFPIALIVPLTDNFAIDPLSNSTVTPGWIVNVTPAATFGEDVNTYGLPAVVHVVFDVISDDTVVAASA